jgi:hypothetical protein
MEPRMAPTMKGDSEVAARVPDAMDAQVICHVRHLVLLIRLLRVDLHGFILAVFIWEVVSGLSQATPQDLHEAMSVAMVVDGAALAGTPHEHKLYLWSAQGGSFFGTGMIILRGCSCHSLRRRGF